MITDLLPGDPAKVGPYRVIARIGAGGMGVVYLATSPDHDVVAIKLVRSDLADDNVFRARFRLEVEAARRVGGTYTARVRDADVDGPRPWVVTDFVAGPNLGDLIADHGPLAGDQQVALAAGLAEALTAVHAAGVNHRDIKPANVLCSPSGPRLIDFGIARAADATSATLTGQILGSPSWMAPEQVRGQPTTAAVDMFALGSILAFAATGRPPFGDGQLETVMFRILNDPPDLGAPGQIADDLRTVLPDLLAKDPTQRPSPSEVLARLGASGPDSERAVTQIMNRTWILPEDETVEVATRMSGLDDQGGGQRRQWVLGAVTLVVALALVAGIALALLSGHPEGLKAASATATTNTTTAPVPTTIAPVVPPSTAAVTTVPPPATTAPPSTAPPTTVPPTTVPPTTAPPQTIPVPAPSSGPKAYTALQGRWRHRSRCHLQSRSQSTRRTDHQLRRHWCARCSSDHVHGSRCGVEWAESYVRLCCQSEQNHGRHHGRWDHRGHS